MWYVEGIYNWNTGEKERYEGLTEKQKADIHNRMWKEGYTFVRSGRMFYGNCS